MAKKQKTVLFDDLLKEVQESWTEEDWKIYNAVSEDFQTEMRDRSELGAALQLARKAQFLTQPKLSELADVQQAEISRIERGVGNPTAATLFRLTHALGLRIALLPAEKTGNTRT